MVSEINWTKEALNNLGRNSEIHFRKTLRFTQERTIKAIYKSVEKLIGQPEIGMPVALETNYNIRRILFKSFRIIYCYHSSKIYIVSVSWQSKPWQTDFDFLEDYVT